MQQDKSLLTIVQSTLASMDSDAVQHIGETAESEQIAILAQEKYLELATYQRIPQFEELTQLLGVADSDRATVMKIPDGATDIADVRYRHVRSDGKEFMKEVHFVPRSNFLDSQLSLATGTTSVGHNILDGNIQIPYRTDRGPTCWTTFDDEYLVFDAIDRDTAQDDTLHNDASLVLAYIIPEFKLEDDFVPDLPIKLITQYMNMIKETAFYEQKQSNNPFRSRDAEREAHRNKHFAGIADGLDQGEGAQRQRPNYGHRFGRGYRQDRTSRSRY